MKIPWRGVCIGNIFVGEKEKYDFPHLILYRNNVQQAPEWITRFFKELHAQFQFDLIVKSLKDIVPENRILLSQQLIKSTKDWMSTLLGVHCLVKEKQTGTLIINIFYGIFPLASIKSEK